MNKILVSRKNRILRLLIGMAFILLTLSSVFYEDVNGADVLYWIMVFSFIVYGSVHDYQKYNEKIKKYQDNKLLEIEKEINVFVFMISVAFIITSTLIILTLVFKTGEFLFLFGMLPVICNFILVFIYRRKIMLNDKKMILFYKYNSYFEIIKWNEIEKVKFAETQDGVTLFLKKKERRIFEKRIMKDEEWDKFVEIIRNKIQITNPS